MTTVAMTAFAMTAFAMSAFAMKRLRTMLLSWCVVGMTGTSLAQAQTAPQVSAPKPEAQKKLKLVEPEKPATVEVSFQWNYKNFPLRIRAFEISDPMNLDINRNFTVPNLQASPLTSELRTVSVRKGGFRNFALVVQNDTDRDIYFYAAPHDMNPSTLSLGTRFRCLCYNHVYRAPAKMTWYRTVQLRAEKETDGTKLKIDHSVIGVSEKELAALRASTIGE